MESLDAFELLFFLHLFQFIKLFLHHFIEFSPLEASHLTSEENFLWLSGFLGRSLFWCLDLTEVGHLLSLELLEILLRLGSTPFASGTTIGLEIKWLLLSQFLLTDRRHQTLFSLEVGHIPCFKFGGLFNDTHPSSNGSSFLSSQPDLERTDSPSARLGTENWFVEDLAIESSSFEFWTFRQLYLDFPAFG